MIIVISVILAFLALLGLIVFVDEIRNASSVGPKGKFLHDDYKEKDTVG